MMLLCQKTQLTLNNSAEETLRSLSGAILYTSLNTLVPLLTHQSKSAVLILANVVRRILKLYPERASWSVMGLQYSSRQERIEVFEKEVIKPMKEAGKEYKHTLELISEAKLATVAINKLASFKVQPGTKKVNFHDFDFYKPLARKLPLRLVVPIKEQLILTLPSYPINEDEAGSLFAPAEAFVSVLNEAMVMSSLQNPKRATFITTTGMKRSFLCKARDELRKDLRIMELCHVMNLLLKKNPETRRRQLYTRTFCVTMTGDVSGMIEWVNDVKPFRLILDDLYARSGLGIKNDAIKAIHKQKEAKKITPGDAFNKILSAFPPIMRKWLIESFPDPTSWFRARNTFTKSAAVWSMIGHIVGLGDRHAENILIDTNTGDMVHVDFAVLFDKGMNLMVPEVVRFRLTQNIVDAFGICGVEGVYRRCSELTMSVMRSNKDMVMSVLDLFVHDPCMEKTEGGMELAYIGRRLDGYFDEPSEVIRKKRRILTGGVQLGIPGQVQKLIANATAHENLSVIYVWWMPWY